ncbi:MAG: acetyltransferase [Candidatus Entotheonella factor]|uniref:Acetyltransferase n=1 Tax=Entotheonella factor TaxID=1429438 RepID=W4LCT9_ENTF1|nr:GNAT family N-acetyltransferase [Candidatus Entotheonella palauensis]ETW95787.1 MAG: acetyltransferase [Candidatus Entotheonella factor]
MKRHQVVLRPARLHDREALFPIARDFATSFEVEREPFMENFAALLEEDDAWLRVGEANGHLIAYLLGFDHLTFFANGRVSWVEEVTVIESWRGQGVGAALMSEFEQWAKSRGSRLVALATRRAAPFYQAIGYEESATYFRRLL